jgi:hypothetical protein
MQDTLQFYPSTAVVVSAIWDGFENKEVQAVLDPEAGNGALLEPQMDARWNSYRRCDAIEIDMDHHKSLKDKGVQMVGFDFLDFPDASIYSHVVMNPPFAVGCKHLLHAWNILMDGEIGCVLNAETIRNPYSKERQQLLKLISDHGKVQFLSNAFSREAGASRSTDVEIAIVHLKKTVSNSAFIGNVVSRMEADLVDEVTDDMVSNPLAVANSTIKNMVLAYKCAWDAKKSALIADARASYYLGILGKSREEVGMDSTDTDVKNGKRKLKNELFQAQNDIRERAWFNILRSSDVDKLTTSKVQSEIEKQFDTIKKMAFTVKNIYGFLSGLAENMQEIQSDAVLEVFDLITRYNTDNRVYYMGWKSNDEHRRVGMSIKKKRFILPYFNAPSWSGGNFDSKRLKMLSDIDLVFSLLDGKRKVDNGMVSVCENNMAALKSGDRVSSTYFDLRYYKGKGTIHFFPKSQELVDRLNVFVGKQRQWLPEDMTKTSDQFVKQFDDAEKNEKEFAAHLSSNGNTGSSYNNDAEEVTNSDFIGNAMHNFLSNAGYDVDLMLEKPESAKQLEHIVKPRTRLKM